MRFPLPAATCHLPWSCYCLVATLCRATGVPVSPASLSSHPSPQHSGQAMYVTTWPETWPHWLSALRMMFIFVGNNSLHLAITGRSCETTSRAIHAGAAFQCGIIIPGSTSSCALLDSRASSCSRLNNSCIQGPPCRHPLVGGPAKEKQWYFKVLLKSGSPDAWPPQSSGHCVARRLLEVDFG